MTTLTAEPSALDVLRAGGCTPSCLLGMETGRCHCRCQGAHHGELLSSLTRQADATTAPVKPGRAARRRKRKGRRA
jgi:hypothetical protein